MDQILESGKADAYGVTIRDKIVNIRTKVEAELGEGGMETLLNRSKILQEIKNDKLTGKTLNSDSFTKREILKSGIIEEYELNDLIKTKDYKQIEYRLENTAIGDIERAKLTIGEIIRNTFEEAFEPERIKSANPSEIMISLLEQSYEDMNATRGKPKATVEENITEFYGKTIQDILTKNENELRIIIGTDATTGEAITSTIQELVEHSKNRNLIRRTNDLKITEPLEKIKNIIRQLTEGKIDEDTNNILDGQFLSKLFTDENKISSEVVSNLSEEDALFMADFMELADDSTREQVEKEIKGRYTKGIMDPITEYSTAEERIKLLQEQNLRIKKAEAEAEKRLNLMAYMRERHNLQYRMQTEESMLLITAQIPTSYATTKVKSVLERDSELLDRYASGTIATGEAAAEAERAITASLAEASAENPAKYQRVGDAIKGLFDRSKPLAERGALGDFAESLSRNKSTLIGAAAIGTGLAVFAHITKRDHTKESIAGPPLLPGGNPYERMPQSPMQLPMTPRAGGEQGVGYDVSINGDREQTDAFMANAGMLTNGQVTGTMRNGSPQLGRNSYDDIAGSF